MGRSQKLEDRVLQITRKIVDYEKRAEPFLREIEILKKELAALVAGREPAPRPKQDHQVSLEAFLAEGDTLTIGERVVEFLEKSPDETFQAEAIAAALGMTNMPTLRSTLLRLYNKGLIAREYRGGYTAHPAPSKEAAT